MGTIRKVFTCTYIGHDSRAPRILQVPSEHSSGRPSGSEFVAALKNMGFDDGQAHAIAMGGSNLHWKCD